MPPRFEFGILCSLLEEIREGRIQIQQRLLKNDRTDLGKKGFLRLLFPFAEFQCGLVIAHGFLLSSCNLCFSSARNFLSYSIARCAVISISVFSCFNCSGDWLLSSSIASSTTTPPESSWILT